MLEPRIARVREEDFSAFSDLIRALAEYEKLDPPNQDAFERLRRDALSDRPRFEAYLLRLSDSTPIGYFILFYTYSSFLALPTLYLEDLFILPEYRRMGYGSLCFQFLAQHAKEQNCGRIEWQVLDWNEPAITFYNRLGATHMREWFPYRITADHFDSIVEGRHEN